MSQAVCDTCGTSGEFAPAATCPACSGTRTPSTAVFGKYTLTAEIGRGSMGVVHDAQDNTLNRRVAIKIMHARREGEPKEAVTEWQRFLQEARLTANVAKHPSIVTVYEAAVQDTRRYIAMEYIAGEPLGRWRQGRSTRELVRLLRDVARAVHHAHEHGIIHRDLKPGNVLVGKGGVPVVTDFGLATYERRSGSRSLTPTGYAVGSPAYMSPEQARGQKDLGRATDIYSLGIMLYEIIAGRPPFAGKNPVETLSRVVEGTSVRPSAAAPLPGADPELDAICMKAIALDPKDRPATAAEFADALTRWLERGQAGARGRPRAWQIAVLAALSLSLAGILVWNRREARRREAEHRTQLESMERRIRELNAIAAAPPLVPPLDTFRERNPNPNNSSSAGKISFWAAGLFEGDVQVPETGDYNVIIRAACDEARGEMAKFRLTIDDQRVGDVLLTATSAREYALPAHLTAGAHRLGIEFTNDFYDAVTREDRNLWIHHVELKRAR